MCRDCARHRVNQKVVIDTTKPTGDLLRSGATNQNKFEDAIRRALIDRSLVKVDDLDDTENGGVTITRLTDD